VSTRGKEVGSGVKRLGLWFKHTYYEHVMIRETEDPVIPGQRRRVEVFFTEYYQSTSIS
jgi:hypothetical protein